MKRLVVAIGWLAAAAILSSCSRSSVAVPESPAAKKTAEAAKRDKGRESWDIFLLQGNRVGYDHVTVRCDSESGCDVLRTENTSHLALRRGTETSRQEIRILSIEGRDGRLLRFECEVGIGVNPIRTTGSVRGDRLEILTTGLAAATAKTSLPWSTDNRGPFAIEQSLLRKPMQPGERRTFKVLMIEFQQVANVELTAKGYEPCLLRTGRHDLLRIETVATLPDNQKIEQTVWSDRTGDVLKSLTMVMGGLETYRVSKAEALEKTAAALDLLPSMIVKVEQPLANIHQTKQIRYRIHLEGSDPASVFATGPTQSIKSIDANTAEITVHAIRPGEADGNPNAPADPPTDDDLRPNVFVQSDDPLIVADAKKAAGDEKDPWRVAIALERFVNREVTNKNFSQTFASAAEVAKSHEGDCTEHAVFLIALCRARGIPARAAIGLVGMENSQAFGYHMWAEAYIDKRWIPIDGTLALGGIGAGHLKIAQSNLKDASAYVAFWPVTQILGRLSITIVDAK